jgi:hypothetical protein
MKVSYGCPVKNSNGISEKIIRSLNWTVGRSLNSLCTAATPGSRHASAARIKQRYRQSRTYDRQPESRSYTDGLAFTDKRSKITGEMIIKGGALWKTITDFPAFDRHPTE